MTLQEVKFYVFYDRHIRIPCRFNQESNKISSIYTLSKEQISKNLQSGGNLFSSPASLGARMLLYAIQAVTKLAPALASEAAQVLGSLGIDKIFGRGNQVGR